MHQFLVIFQTPLRIEKKKGKKAKSIMSTYWLTSKRPSTYYVNCKGILLSFYTLAFVILRTFYCLYVLFVYTYKCPFRFSYLHISSSFNACCSLSHFGASSRFVYVTKSFTHALGRSENYKFKIISSLVVKLKYT